MKFSELNDKRTAEFKKTDDDFLLRFHDALGQLEAELINSNEHYKGKHPLLFVFGLPRSGTTLTAQILINGLRASYINNLIARFWKVPLTGIQLSNILKIKQNVSFESNYAWTEGLSNLHEFGYYWRELFSLDDISQLENMSLYRQKLPWEQIRMKVRSLQVAFNDTLVMKNIYGAYFIPELTKTFEQQLLWVWIQRDKAEVATSIYYARLKFYGDANTWWSTYPPNFDQPEGLGWFDQIFNQVNALFAYYQSQVDLINESNVLCYNHFDMLKDPDGFINSVRNKIKNLGFSMPMAHDINADLSSAKDYSMDPVYIQFRKAFS